MEQYLSNDKLKELVNVTDYAEFKPISTDSYSDIEVFKTLRSKGGMEILLYCAIQTAVIGFGNKVFGEFMYKGEKIDVKTIYREYSVRDDLSLNSKIEPGELTPRRLQRFFRAQIHDYLVKNPDVNPYLWKKYSKLDTRFRAYTFPGAESLIEDKECALYLLETYKHLDERLDTFISERVRRVFMARNILKPSDFNQ